jgi:dUTP pyrophosphatase
MDDDEIIYPDPATTGRVWPIPIGPAPMPAGGTELLRAEPIALPCKLLDPAARLPTRGSDFAAGLDLYAIANPSGTAIMIDSGDIEVINTGVAVQIPPGYAARIVGRSGLASGGVFPIGGLIDSDYRGEILVILKNDGHESFYIKTGDRIGQLVLFAVPDFIPVAVAELDPTGRGEAGFGSTGRS